MSFDNTYIHCGKAKKMSNKYNVFASLLSAKPEDAGMIAAWMADREAEKDVMDMEVVTCRYDATRLNEIRGDYDGNISVGDVRILSKQFTSEPDIIPYVAVLEEWEKGVWLIVPFSHYATPATPGEMSTGIDMHGLRVLQAWNGRTVQTSILKKSFLFDRLSDKVREDALALFRHEMGGVSLPKSFSAKRGIPIVNEADPRREYISESIERLQPLAEAVLKEAESREVILVGSDSDEGGMNRLIEIWFGGEVAACGIAAADDQKNALSDCVIPDLNVNVRVEAANNEKKIYVRVYGEDGEPSNLIDGWEILDAKSDVCGRIENGFCVLEMTAGVPNRLFVKKSDVTNHDL